MSVDTGNLPMPPGRAQSRLGTWFDHHVYSLVASVGRMLRKPWATLLTVGVMAVALALPLGLWVALQNVQRFTGDVQQARQVSVFLKPEVARARATELAAQLRARGDVAAVEHRTPEQGLAELRERSGLSDVLAGVDGNPLPHLLLVMPRGDETLLADALQALPEADVVMLIGARLNWLLSHGKGKTWGGKDHKDWADKKFVQIDISAQEMDSNVPIDAPNGLWFDELEELNQSRPEGVVVCG